MGPVIMGRAAFTGMVGAFMAAQREGDEFAVAVSVMRPAKNPAMPILVAVEIEGTAYAFTVADLGRAIAIIDTAVVKQMVNYGEAQALADLLDILRKARDIGANTSPHGLH